MRLRRALAFTWVRNQSLNGASVKQPLGARSMIVGKTVNSGSRRWLLEYFATWQKKVETPR